MLSLPSEGGRLEHDQQVPGGCLSGVAGRCSVIRSGEGFCEAILGTLNGPLLFHIAKSPPQGSCVPSKKSAPRARTRCTMRKGEVLWNIKIRFFVYITPCRGFFFLC